MGRAPCCDKNGLKKGPWTSEEDQKLIDYIQKHGHGSWRTLPKNAGLARCGKSCRLRWTNYLRPDIKRGRFSFEEEETIIQLHSILGNKWSAIAARLPGRTDNEIKNYWNTHIRKRLLRMGIDPVTHSPRLDLLELSPLLNPSLYNTAHLEVSRLMGIEPFVNAEILRLATNLLTCQRQTDPNFLNQNLQEPNFSSPQIQGTLPTFQPCPLQRAVQDMAGSTTASTTQFLGEQLQAMQTNVELFQPDAHGNNQWQASEPLRLVTESYASSMPANVSYQLHSQQVMALPHMVPNDTNFEMASPDHQGFDPSPVLSTSTSSQTRLNRSPSSPYINSSGTEDERDSYCNDLFDFRIPDLLDAEELI